MRMRASWLAAALLAFAGCGEDFPSRGTADGQQAVTEVPGSGDDGACVDARIAFRTCRAAVSCDAQADALRACVMGHGPIEEEGPPPRRRGDDPVPPQDGDDCRPPRGGDDGRPPRGGDDGRPPRGGDDGCGHGHDDGEPNPRPLPPFEFPEECQPLADELAACERSCDEEREAMVEACTGACRSARQEAESCLENTPACASPWLGVLECLESALQVCNGGVTADGSGPSRACLEAVAACLDRDNHSCEATCGPLVRTAREACAGIAHDHPDPGHGHHGGSCDGEEPGHFGPNEGAGGSDGSD